ncbi:hypothetical protein [Nocardiopsis sp. FIRDI 009]|uniref:hypothetical protein n=1 Tax=Nocardiopsis sp. FIRDI 009 TaxID=714197 RepID=UPI001E46A28D|nr:hypothetical protein [Nocardiopsis sp. FIRDI 009]
MTAAALVTLVVAGSLTWTVVHSFSPFGSVGVNPARGLPDDPCAVVGEEVLDDLDAEPSYWDVSEYATGCGWRTLLNGEEEVPLHVGHSVPLAGPDAELVEEMTGEDVPRDAEELYEDEVESAGEFGYESEGSTEVVDTEEKDLDLGDESALVLADIDYGYGPPPTQRVTVLVREGDVVGTIRVSLASSDDLDADGAEELLADVVADVFG